MFTGIIQQMGVITELNLSQQGGTLVVAPKKPFKNCKLGESIAVDGCCLTLVTVSSSRLTFDLSDETCRLTNFKNDCVGQSVNLERALKVGDLLGGHFVSGHVDGVGKISKIIKTKGSLKIQKIQAEGKNPLSAQEFLKGFPVRPGSAFE